MPAILGEVILRVNSNINHIVGYLTLIQTLRKYGETQYHQTLTILPEKLFGSIWIHRAEYPINPIKSNSIP